MNPREYNYTTTATTTTTTTPAATTTTTTTTTIMFRAEDWVEESKGERGLQGVQKQHAGVRRTFFLPQYTPKPCDDYY